MKILIADWGKECGGGRYSMFGVNGITPQECFHTIDRLGNPFQTKYKVFDVEEVFDLHDDGIESQEHLAEIYTESRKKEKDFTKLNYMSLWKS